MMMIWADRSVEVPGSSRHQAIKAVKLATIPDRCDSSWRELREQNKQWWLQRQLKDSSLGSAMFAKLSERREARASIFCTCCYLLQGVMLACPDYSSCLHRARKNAQSTRLFGSGTVMNTWHIPQIFVDRAREMVQALAARPEDPSFIPGTLTMKGKN